MNISKIEGILVVRDEHKKVIAVISRIEGKQEYEIYSTTIASIEEIQALLNNRPEKKL